MTIDPDQRRELAQLRFAAEYYLQLAKRLKRRIESESSSRMPLDETIRNLSANFAVALQAKRNELSVHRLIAHLSSAAVRLVTIEERLSGLCHTPTSRQDLDAKAKGNDRSSLGKLFAKNRSKWLHIFLRDNVAHIERANKPKYQARQDSIESMTPREIFEEMTKITKRVLNTLKKAL